MKRPTLDERGDELRRTVAERRRQLDLAVGNLARVSTDELTLGHHLAKHPWRWLLGACVAGALIALHRQDD